jgi:hypothetical protein
MNPLYQSRLCVPTLDNRQDFITSWLTEAPSGTGNSGGDMFGPLAYAVRDRVAYGSKAVDLANGYKKIIGTETAYYWHEQNGEIDIVVELSITPQTLVITGVGKRAGGATRATELYLTIIQDTKCAVRLMSDDLLSDAGLAVWKRLLGAGHTISVYDGSNPNTGLISLHTEQELMQYFRLHDNSYKRFRYILTETGTHTGEVRSVFNTRRMRFLAGIL